MEGNISINGGIPWYRPYVEYCVDNGIISEERSKVYSYDENATRAGYMEIFANALPDNALKAINNVPDDSIPDDAFDMLNFLKGPEPVSTYEKQFIKGRLSGREYIPFSYFDGAMPGNGYTPKQPMTMAVYENPYSFDNENWATLWVKSSGADNMRSLKLRKKPSTGQWFLNDIQCLPEIKLPTAEDKWA